MRLKTSLLKFFLSNNQIIIVAYNTFIDLLYLNSLDLTNNVVENSEYDSLKGLDSLKNFYIRKNAITYFDDNFQANLRLFSVAYLRKRNCHS